MSAKERLQQTTGIVPGKSAKDSTYLKRIKDAIAGELHHPRNMGIRMQAHHVISGEGMKRSGLAPVVKAYGYNINFLPNLAFIPCTLQGACYLGIQPHRGNHGGKEADQDDYVDAGEERSYHNKVSSDLQRVIDKHLQECTGDDNKVAQDGIEALDNLSKEILKGIQKRPAKYQLTSIATHFGVGGAGCGGVDSVTDHNAGTPCPVDRNHLTDAKGTRQSQAEGQKPEDIKFVLHTKYDLKFEKKGPLI